MASNDELFSAVLRLPSDERARLAHELIASLDPHVDEGVEAAWTAEVLSRAQAVHDGKVELEDGEEVDRRVADRLRARK